MSANDVPLPTGAVAAGPWDEDPTIGYGAREVTYQFYDPRGHRGVWITGTQFSDGLTTEPVVRVAANNNHLNPSRARNMAEVLLSAARIAEDYHRAEEARREQERRPWRPLTPEAIARIVTDNRKD